MFEYKLVEEVSAYSLIDSVNRSIREGWEIRDNLQVIIIHGKVVHTREFYQPMVRWVVEEQED